MMYGLIQLHARVTSKVPFQSNIFIVNLAFSDLMMMTTQALPVGINAFASDSWIWSSFGCKLYACLGGIFGKLLGFLNENYNFHIYSLQSKDIRMARWKKPI